MAELVPVDKIPRLTTEVAIGDSAAVYKKFSKLRSICLQENGVGLSAVQIGLTDDMFVVYNEGNGSFRYFINTRYVPSSLLEEELYTSCEGCLSLPGRTFLVPRYKAVRVVGTEMIVGEGITFVHVDFMETDQFQATVFQHEIDHCMGKLISEIGREIRLRPA